jgi:hypothetical protein
VIAGQHGCRQRHGGARPEAVKRFGSTLLRVLNRIYKLYPRQRVTWTAWIS